MRTLAENTGGLAFVGAANLDAAVDAIVAENQAFYLLGYAPNPAYHDTKFHSLNVVVHRRGLDVRARLGYYADPPVNTPSTEFDKAMASQRQINDLPFRATAIRTGSSLKNMGTVAIGIQIGEDQQTADYRVEYRAIVDSDGRVEKGGTIKPTRFGAANETSLAASVEVPLDTIQLRIGVFDQTHQRGGILDLPLARIVDPVQKGDEPRLLDLAVVNQAGDDASVVRPLPQREFRKGEPLRILGTILQRSVVAEPILRLRSKANAGFLMTPSFRTVRHGDVVWVRSDITLETLSPGIYTVELELGSGPAADRKRLVFRILE